MKRRRRNQISALSSVLCTSASIGPRHPLAPEQKRGKSGICVVAICLLVLHIRLKEVQSINRQAAIAFSVCLSLPTQGPLVIASPPPSPDMSLVCPSLLLLLLIPATLLSARCLTTRGAAQKALGEKEKLFLPRPRLSSHHTLNEREKKESSLFSSPPHRLYIPRSGGGGVRVSVLTSKGSPCAKLSTKFLFRRSRGRKWERRQKVSLPPHISRFLPTIGLTMFLPFLRFPLGEEAGRRNPDCNKGGKTSFPSFLHFPALLPLPPPSSSYGAAKNGFLNAKTNRGERNSAGGDKGSPLFPSNTYVLYVGRYTTYYRYIPHCKRRRLQHTVSSLPPQKHACHK